MIERLRADKLQLNADLNESKAQATKATELKILAEEEVTRLKSVIQAAEMEKEMLQQQVQCLTDIVEYFKTTAAQLMEDFTNRLKLDLSIFTVQ